MIGKVKLVESITRGLIGGRSEVTPTDSTAPAVGPTDQNGATWREAFPGVDFRTLTSGADLMVTMMRFRRGAAAKLHHHGAAQAGYVLEGELRITTPEEQTIVRAGEPYVVPANVPHQIRAIKPSTVVDVYCRGIPQLINP